MDAETLGSLFLFEGLTDEQLADLASRGRTVDFADGDVLFREGEAAEDWWVLLEGRVELLKRMEHENVVIATMENPGQWAGGFRAWSDSAGYLATARAASAGRLMVLSSDALRGFVQTSFPFPMHLIQAFFQTLRNVEAMWRQRAGLVALGTLAAGLAHELNNPAAAAARSADALRETTDHVLAALVGLAQRSLPAERFVALDALRREIQPATAMTGSMGLADAEDALLTWMEDRGVDDAWRIAPALAAAGVDVAWCERAADVLDGDTLGPGLDWVANTLGTAALLSEVSEATRRVSGLVDAVKSYSQLDRASLQHIDVTQGIESTLVVLAHKVGDEITVVRDYADDLPMIDGHPGELNQVWTNLIDNAVDAMDGRGTLRLSARVEGTHVVIEVADTGPGMPDDVRNRAFEPFFTTKDVGRGSGLGLDISRRIIVDRHHGDITISSEPGDTVISVRLPRQHS